MLQNFQTTDISNLVNFEMLGVCSGGLPFIDNVDDKDIREFDDDELQLYDPDDDDDDDIPGGPDFQY